ncbi:zinc finger protein aebp2 isoform X2 [Clupea harengus]|uniref:Zinc finger protein aebp2 isoform X2 n=1 Tax=Clupea harengus TaxID=7950 RepID=A0A6P3WBV8_CLUHA|nr:zinc finger protein aebp2 isoform X2 [Clupea harengus]
MASTTADRNGEAAPAVDEQSSEQHSSELVEEVSGLISDEKSCVTGDEERVEADGGQEENEENEKPSPEHAFVNEEQRTGDCSGEISAAVNESESNVSTTIENDSSGPEREDATLKALKQEPISVDENDSSANKQCTGCKPNDESTDKTVNEGNEDDNKRRVSIEMSSSDGEPLSRMDSEDSISSTLMDMESTASSGRSTPAMMNGQGSLAPSSAKTVAYACCWDHCLECFTSSPSLAEHIRTVHVDDQQGGEFRCLWKGCKVYNTPSTSQSWLHRHMLTHSGDKPFKCVVGGCTASFASQGGLARHVPTHFSQQSSSKLSSHTKMKEESPSKAGLNKRRKLKNKRRRSLPRPHDFFDAQTMDTIRHRAICFNLATHIESRGNGHSVVFHSTVTARRKEDTGKMKVLLHWTPEDILPDVWVNETERGQMNTKAVHLSQLPRDTAVLLDPNIYRTLPQKRLKQRMLL